MEIYETGVGKLFLDRGDLISDYILDHNLWEEELFPVFDELLNPGSVVVEVGSYIGDHTVYLSKHAGIVYAFEPNMRSFERLCANLYLNHCWNVIASNQAIACGQVVREARKGDPWCSGEENRAGLRLVTDPRGRIRTVRLDDLFPKHVDLIKIDTEGMDLHVMRGGIELIKRCSPTIIFEFNGLVAEQNGDTLDSYKNFFADLGYKIEKLSTWNWIARKE